MAKGKKKAAAKKVAAEGKKEDAAEKKADAAAEGADKKEEKKKDVDNEGKNEDAAKKVDAEGDANTAEGEKKKETPPPPPPEEILMRVHMHCEGCARKVQRSLAGFPGVEEVKADSRTQMVVVKGKPAAADPLRVVERLQRKSGRKVELLSPIPPAPETKEEEKKEEAAEKPKPEEEKKEEPPSVTEVVLKVSMHCDACSQEIKRRILKMKAATSSSPSSKDIPSNELENGSLSSISSKEYSVVGGSIDSGTETTVSITVVGASGDLAKKKIFPALFALYYEDCLPKHFTIFGYARSKMTDAELRNMVSKTLTCRIDKRENCSNKMDEFLKRCFYHSGQYDSEDNFAELDKKLKEHEAERIPNRLFYLSIPPNIFIDVVKCASTSASSTNGWTRVIVEKPFGRDSESSANLTKGLKQYLVEDQIFRIDHYLGKELVENLSVLRFSNLVFEPLWSRKYIRNVQLIFSEDFGTEGRGGYFDNYGIIRDIMQNHLLQILALFAMETPVSLDAEDIRNEKVKVLRSMKPLQLDNVVIGQYKGHIRGGITYPAYTDDKTVPKDSRTPTFAAAALFIDNARWDGVPFLMKAGKALHDRRTEIRVQFRHVPGNLYDKSLGTHLDLATNELVIRVQPDEAIYLKVNNKIPGLGMRLDRSKLNLHYAARYSKEIPDAYERLLLDAVEGERRLFIRSDELDAAWALFTPVLKELEEKRIAPELYPYGSRGPVGAHYLAAKYNVRWGDLSAEHGQD